LADDNEDELETLLDRFRLLGEIPATGDVIFCKAGSMLAMT
jgi:hypothetical protein